MPKVQFDGSEDQQAGQPASENQPNTTPAALTPADVEAIVERATSKAFRAIQSSQSKLEKRIKESVQQQVNMLRGNGIDVTPEIERNITNSVKEQLARPDSEDEPEPQPAQVVQPKPAPQNKTVDPSEAFANEQGDIFDVEPLEDTDPEAAMLQGAGSFKEWKRLVVEATRQKAERIRNEPPKAKPQPSVVPPAGAASNLQSEYQAELAKLPKGDIDAIFRLRASFRKRGLNV